MDESVTSPSWSCDAVSYGRRLVAYFDVLGWRDIIARAGNDVERLGQLRSLVGFYGYLQQVTGGNQHDAALTAFSDNVVISVRYEEAVVAGFIETIGRYQIAAALNGFYLRGAVTVGDLIHDTTCVFGPALVRAYVLESTDAKFSRIILDPEARELAGIQKHVRVAEGFATIDVFGADFVRDCVTPTIHTATSSPRLPLQRNDASSGMRAIPAAPLRMILAKVRNSLGETITPSAREKLVWLEAEVEAGLASLAIVGGRAT